MFCANENDDGAHHHQHCWLQTALIPFSGLFIECHWRVQVPKVHTWIWFLNWYDDCETKRPFEFIEKRRKRNWNVWNDWLKNEFSLLYCRRMVTKDFCSDISSISSSNDKFMNYLYIVIRLERIFDEPFAFFEKKTKEFLDILLRPNELD